MTEQTHNIQNENHQEGYHPLQEEDIKHIMQDAEKREHEEETKTPLTKTFEFDERTYEFELRVYGFKEKNDYHFFKDKEPEKRTLPPKDFLLFEKKIKLNDIDDIKKSAEAKKELPDFVNEIIKELVSTHLSKYQQYKGFGLCIWARHHQETREEIDWFLGFGLDSKHPIPPPYNAPDSPKINKINDDKPISESALNTEIKIEGENLDEIEILNIIDMHGNMVYTFHNVMPSHIPSINSNLMQLKIAAKLKEGKYVLILRNKHGDGRKEFEVIEDKTIAIRGNVKDYTPGKDNGGIKDSEVILGWVISKESGKVRLRALLKTKTDEHGGFYFHGKIPNGEYLVLAKREGYVSFSDNSSFFLDNGNQLTNDYGLNHHKPGGNPHDFVKINSNDFNGIVVPLKQEIKAHIAPKDASHADLADMSKSKNVIILTNETNRIQHLQQKLEEYKKRYSKDRELDSYFKLFVLTSLLKNQIVEYNKLKSEIITTLPPGIMTVENIFVLENAFKVIMKYNSGNGENVINGTGFGKNIIPDGIIPITPDKAGKIRKNIDELKKIFKEFEALKDKKIGLKWMQPDIKKMLKQIQKIIVSLRNNTNKNLMINTPTKKQLWELIENLNTSLKKVLDNNSEISENVLKYLLQELEEILKRLP